MVKRLAVLLVATFSLPAAAELADVEAKRIAIEMDRVVTTARSQLDLALSSGNGSRYKDARKPVVSAIDQWPAQKLSNRAVFPYFQCRQAAIDLLQYGDALAKNDKDTAWRDRALRDYVASSAGCKSSIKSPDLSLKDIQ